MPDPEILTEQDPTALRQRPSSRVVAIVPMFRPSAGQVAALSSLAEQVGHVVAVDDGSTASDDARFSTVDEETTTVIQMPSNVGIAQSLNAGIEFARSLGATHVLTVDQDSRLRPRYVEHALEALAMAASAGVRVGGVGAGLIGPHRVEGEELLPGLRNGGHGIQSGWLVPSTTIDDIGGFDDRLFIDCVDVDFLMRCERARLPIVVSDTCAIEHPLGVEEREIRLLGKRTVFSYHAPFRRYYITRNRIEMVRRYGVAFPRTMLQQFVLASRIAGLCLVFGAHRRAQVVAILAGSLDGLTGRLGRIPERTERALLEPVA